MLVIPGDSSQLIISCNYDPTGLATVDLFDNPCIGWLVDEMAVTSTRKPGDPVPPIEELPVVIGTMPPASVATTPILSPQWAHFVGNNLYVPDQWRGTLVDFFTWIATNNGAQRKVRANFTAARLKNAMDIWASNNPDLFNPEPF